jgi:hypothetical protein
MKSQAITRLAENLDIFAAKGLSEVEAKRLLRNIGHNELPSAKPRSVLAVALEVAREPMFILLVAGGSNCWDLTVARRSPGGLDAPGFRPCGHEHNLLPGT